MTALRAFRYTCENGHTFEAPRPAASYAELLAVSGRPGSERAVRTFDDPVHEELEALLEGVVGVISEAARGELHQRALEVVLDPDEDGSSFSVLRDPACPVCGTDQMEWWESVEPPVAWQEELPIATHRLWDSLSRDEKIARLRSLLE